MEDAIKCKDQDFQHSNMIQQLINQSKVKNVTFNPWPKLDVFQKMKSLSLWLSCSCTSWFFSFATTNQKPFLPSLLFRFSLEPSAVSSLLFQIPFSFVQLFLSSFPQPKPFLHFCFRRYPPKPPCFLSLKKWFPSVSRFPFRSLNKSPVAFAFLQPDP